MRYQERIYIQNENKAVRNKDILNVNMSSDICIFETPMFSFSGGTKLDCSTGATSGTSYVITGSTDTIPLTFDFTANTSSFINTNAIFKYEIYKYSDAIGEFNSTAVYKSNQIPYSAFSATNSTTQYIPSSQLDLDGEYIIKPFFQYGACTEFMSKLNKKIDSSVYITGTIYGIYNPELDYYFIAVRQAEVPFFIGNTTNNPPAFALFQSVIPVESGQTQIVMSNLFVGDFLLSLNGLILAKDVDYAYSAQIISLSGSLVSDDIVTIIYTTAGSIQFSSDYYNIGDPIVSGATDMQGTNSVYFNTTTGKYEVYTSITPASGNAIVMMLNGATLASGIDYYQSSTNPKRLILEGDLMVGDLITLVYLPVISTAGGLNTNTPLVTWVVSNPPTQNNGYFSLEVSTGNTFSNFYYSGNTPYDIGSSHYSDSFVATGSVGTKLYYRVKNTKDYVTICNDIVSSVSYSEIIPVTIQTNSINTY